MPINDIAFTLIVFDGNVFFNTSNNLTFGGSNIGVNTIFVSSSNPSKGENL